jgi:hypothetical protein
MRPFDSHKVLAEQGSPSLSFARSERTHKPSDRSLNLSRPANTAKGDLK